MLVRELGEFRLIDRIARICSPSRGPTQGIRLGIGDDAAALEIPSGQILLSSVDQLNEGVHFDLKWCSLKDLGWKALSAAISDIFANYLFV